VTWNAHFYAKKNKTTNAIVLTSIQSTFGGSTFLSLHPHPKVDCLTLLVAGQAPARLSREKTGTSVISGF
jgi:hypothetical protein